MAEKGFTKLSRAGPKCEGLNSVLEPALELGRCSSTGTIRPEEARVGYWTSYTDRRRMIIPLLSLTCTKFAHITVQACQGLQNYSAVVAIISGLHSAPVYRLDRTWSQVSKRACDILDPLRQLTSSEQNFRAYRELLRNATPPCIPFLGTLNKKKRKKRTGGGIRG